MKKIEAIIRPSKLDDLYTELRTSGFSGITVTEVRGYGTQKGHKEKYRGTEHNLDFVHKVKVELVCPDNKIEEAIRIIIEKNKTGKVGDGKIFVVPVETAIRIRTEESGESIV